MRTNKTLARYFFVFALLLASTAGEAQLPDTIGYQGFLTNSPAGTPVTATVNLTFRIYDSASGGVALWTETHSSVAVSDGAFAVQLGSITGLRAGPSALDFDRPYFLSIAVGTDGEMSARLPLSSAPYALKSGKSRTEVTVDCASGSVQDAIDGAPSGGRLIVNVSGVCNENLDFGRSSVTLRGVNLAGASPVVENPPTNGIVGQVDDGYAVRVRGGRRVVLDNLVIKTATSVTKSDGGGVLVSDGGSVEIKQSWIRENYRGVIAGDSSNMVVEDSVVEANSSFGVGAFESSALDLLGSTVDGNTGEGVSASSNASIQMDHSADGTVPTLVQNNGEVALSITNGAHGRVLNSVIHGGGFAALQAGDGASVFVQDTTMDNNAPGTSNTTISLFRSANLRLFGDNTITNAAAGARVIEVVFGSQVRQDRGTATISGDIVTFDLSGIDIRHATINGNVRSGGDFTTIRLRGVDNGNVTVANNTVVNGTVFGASSKGTMSIRTDGGVRINGNIDCSTGTEVSGGFTNFGAGGAYVNGC